MDFPNILGSSDKSVSPLEEAPVILDEKDINPKDLVIQDKFRSVCSFILEKYDYADRARQETESKWLNAIRAYRGEPTPEEKSRMDRVKQRNPYASEVFIKITKTKTLAAYGQILDILFSEEHFPIGVKPTDKPEGVAEKAFVAPEAFPDIGPADAYGHPEDGKELEPGATYTSILGGLVSKYKGLLGGKKVIEGKSPDPKQFPQISPAEEAADNLQKVILDQLEEGDAATKLRQCVLECVMLGTGVLKGPFTIDDKIHHWEMDSDTKELSYAPMAKRSPRLGWVSAWNFYPDPDAIQVEDAAYVIERHLFSRHKLRELKNHVGFDKSTIDRLLLQPAKYERKYWENLIRDANIQSMDQRYEVLEYWGYLEKDMLAGWDIDKSELEKLTDVAQVNVWICNNEVLRLVINPFVPCRIPYYTVPYEEQSQQIWGVGIPENMKDPQMLMNGHMRMGINNLSYAGNTILEVNENQLVPGQDMSLYPGKIFRKQGGAPGQSIYGITVPNVAPAHMQMFDKARQLADEVTGQPSYSYGQTGVSGVGKTASGISMLMSASGLNIKTVIKNFDHYLLTPLGEAYFLWNMQFNNKDLDIRGDVRIEALGTASLMQREVQSQRLLSFIQVTANPQTAPFANTEYLMRQLAKSLGLDPEQAVNDPTTAMLYADILGKMGQAQMPPDPNAQGTPPGANPQDQTGGGGSQIGVGSQPQPGEPQSSAPDSNA